jgi:hypothetical protein
VLTTNIIRDHPLAGFTIPYIFDFENNGLSIHQAAAAAQCEEARWGQHRG